MSERLRSVGLDVGTTTTQLIVSELTVQNRASGFAVPKMEITGREILYKSPVYFTPLLDGRLVDGARIRQIVEAEYEKAGITRQSVDTGAIIITGETSRKENAGTVLKALAGFAGEFVAATAGPDLESVLAARGAGAVEWSKETGKTVLHMDIGGGTSNLAWIADGRIIGTGCLNVGGRLLKFDPQGKIDYVSPVLQGLCDLQVGQTPTLTQVELVAQKLVQALEMAAGLRKATPLLRKLITEEAAGTWPVLKEAPAISFSGGVADCIETVHPPYAFGDMGPVLGEAIGKSQLSQGQYRLGKQTIRATVIGAGCHSAQLSGSTVFYKNIPFPLKNLPVAVCTAREQFDLQALAEKLRSLDGEWAVLAIPGIEAPDYGAVQNLAAAISEAAADRPIVVCLQQDMAKALGQCLSLQLPKDRPCLCIDGICLEEGSFLDVGSPVGPALPVVIKTLILSQ